jgi:hypothetical protein
MILTIEPHKSGGYHYHMVITLSNGISKNTYRDTIRLMFPIFEGRGIDISGIKNLNRTLKYILKGATKGSTTLHNVT